MTYPLALTTADRKAYEAALAGSRAMKVTVEIRDRNEAPLTTLTAAERLVVDGYVTIDAAAQISRSLTLAVLDPLRRLHLEPSSPSPYALFADCFIRVTRSDWAPALARWIEVPVFYGPVRRFERRNELVTIEAVGKEVLLLAPHLAWYSRTFKAGANVIEVIQTIAEAAGETRFRLPTGQAVLKDAVSITPYTEPWLVMKRLAAQINRRLFYDGNGRLTLGPFSAKPDFVFTDGGDGSVVLTVPTVAYDFDQVRNVIEVLGPEPAKGKTQIRAVARPGAAHPLSEWSLARNGKPRKMIDTVTIQGLKRPVDAQAIADDRLAERLRVSTVVGFDCLPIPHLEELDFGLLRQAGPDIGFRLRQFTIPLTSDGVMTVGTLKRPTVRRRMRRPGKTSRGPIRSGAR